MEAGLLAAFRVSGEFLQIRSATETGIQPSARMKIPAGQEKMKFLKSKLHPGRKIKEIV